MAADRHSLVTGSLVLLTVVGMLFAAPLAAGQEGAGDIDYSGSSGELTRGEPDIDAFLPQPELAAGTEETLEIQVQNQGELSLGTQRDRVTNARGASVEIVDDGPFDVRSGEAGVGSLSEGQTATVEQRIAAPDDLDSGEHDVTVEVSYDYTRQVSDAAGASQDRTGSETIDLTIVVPDDPRFEITDVDTDVEPGGDGPATLEITNAGSETATQARATITGGGGVTVDGEAAEEVLGDLESGDSETVTVDVAIDESTSEGAKPLDVEFTYRDSAGVEREATPEVATLAPAPEQTFSITNLEDTLAVGYDGTVAGEITNDGPRTVDDAVLIVEPMTESLFVEDTRYALPEIEPGETAAFSYPTDVSGQADAGPRQLRFSVEYTAGDRSTLEDGPISERVVIDDHADEFSLLDDGITVEQGDSSEFTLEITNERAETLSNIDAMLYTDSPLSTTNDEAYVDELEPGESAEIAFDVHAAPNAPTETHPVELDFEYDTERGETELSDVYQHPIEVEPGEDDGGMGIGGLVVRLMALATAVGVGGTLWWRLR